MKLPRIRVTIAAGKDLLTYGNLSVSTAHPDPVGMLRERCFGKESLLLFSVMIYLVRQLIL